MSRLRYFNRRRKRFWAVALVFLLALVLDVWLFLGLPFWDLSSFIPSNARTVKYLKSTNQIEVHQDGQTVRFAMPFPPSESAYLYAANAEWSPDGKYVDVWYGNYGSSGSTIVLDLVRHRTAVVGGRYLFSGCGPWSQDSRRLSCGSSNQYGDSEEIIFDVDSWMAVSTGFVKGCYGREDSCTPTRY